MNKSDVRIEKLEPSRVAFTKVFSSTPEEDAMGKLIAWAKPKGLTLDPEKNKCFGFNDPCPEEGETEYEYEVWLTVGQDIQPEGEIDVKNFEGGLYAVATVRKIEEIGPTWGMLVEWCKDSGYKHGASPGLERHRLSSDQETAEGFRLDLMLPILK